MKEDWITETLNDICLRISDGAHQSPPTVDKGRPMASVKDLTPYGINLETCRDISEEDYVKLTRYGCKPQQGDILISKDGATALDVVCEVKSPIEVVLLSSIAILRPDTTKVSSKFLRYYLDSEPVRAYMKGSFTTGAAIPRVVLKDFKCVKIKYPELGTQNRINSVLSTYDDLIENNLRRIKILEEMAKTIYDEWFVKFRFPGHENVKMIESELGLIPEGWEVRRVGDSFITVLGGTPSRAKPEYWENGNIPWINSGKVNELRIIDPSEFITTLGLTKSATKVMKPSTTVIAITGATLGQVSILCDEMCANQSVVGIHDSAGLYREYIYRTFQNKIQSIIQHASGGAQQHINKEIVDNVKYVCPSEVMVKSFNRLAFHIGDEVENLLRKNNILRQTRDLLLPKLISGEIDVENLDIKTEEPWD